VRLNYSRSHQLNRILSFVEVTAQLILGAFLPLQGGILHAVGLLFMFGTAVSAKDP